MKPAYFAQKQGLSYEEQRSYRERGWELPKRCPAYLDRRRYERNSAPLQTVPAQAGAERTRVPEIVLLGLAFLDGWPLAYVAIYHFRARHKTQKIWFQFLFWAIVALYVMILCSYFIGVR